MPSAASLSRSSSTTCRPTPTRVPSPSFLTGLAATLRAARGALVLVRGRPGRVLLTDDDRRWHELVLATCRREEVLVLGAYLATPAVVRAFPGALGEDDLAS